ncbi:MAG: hypothetical protein AAB152_01415 [Candidatus Coatesbacteria bacterium]
MKSRTASPPLIQTKVPLLTLLVAKDNGRFMARCPELDLVTEMDRQEETIQAMIEMIREYAEDYTRRIKEFATSPNRAHHRPYVDRIAACENEWAVRELIEVRFGRVHV